MKTVSPEYAAEHFSELIQAVHAGEDILVAGDRGPIARIVPYAQDPQQGAEASDDADAPRDEVEQAFYGD